MEDKSRTPNSSSEEDLSEFPADAGEFRWAAADLLKCLIYARESADPGFLSDVDYVRWEIDLDQLKKWTTEQLLRESLRKFRHLELFVGPRSSGGLPVLDDAIGELRRDVGLFADPEWALPDALDHVRQGLGVDWDGLAAWDTLGEMRDRLDKLPQADGSPVVRRTSIEITVGPIAPRHFRWNGEDILIEPVMVARLISTLWPKCGTCVELESLAKPVWETEHLDYPDKGKAYSLRGNANSFFRANGLPFRVKVIDDETAQRPAMLLVDNREQ